MCDHEIGRRTWGSDGKVSLRFLISLKKDDPKYYREVKEDTMEYRFCPWCGTKVKDLLKKNHVDV